MNDGLFQLTRCFETLLFQGEFLMIPIRIRRHYLDKTSRFRIISKLSVSLSRCSHSAHGGAMIPAITRHDFITSATIAFTRLEMVLAGDFERRFIGLGTAAGEINVQRRTDHLLNLGSKLNSWFTRHRGR